MDVDEQLAVPCDIETDIAGSAKSASRLSSSSLSPYPLLKKKRSRLSVEERVVSVPIAEAGGASGTDPPADAWAWRKYGQQMVPGSPYPRGFYQCNCINSQGCPAMKQVNRSDEDPTMVVVTYRYEHNHSCPLPKNNSNSISAPAAAVKDDADPDTLSDFTGDDPALLAATEDPPPAPLDPAKPPPPHRPTPSSSLLPTPAGLTPDLGVPAAQPRPLRAQLSSLDFHSAMEFRGSEAKTNSPMSVERPDKFLAVDRSTSSQSSPLDISPVTAVTVEDTVVALQNTIDMVLVLQERTHHGKSLPQDLLTMQKSIRGLVDVLDRMEGVESEENKSGSHWLTDLKALVFDATNVVDEFRYKLQQEEGDLSSTLRMRKWTGESACSNDSVLDGLASRMRDVVERIKEMESRAGAIQLRKEPTVLVMDAAMPSASSPAASPSDSSTDIYGREEDKEKLIGSLLLPVNQSIVITGMGGIGKTTLLRLVYDDSRVRRHFDQRMWFSLPEQFDVRRLAETIEERISAVSCSSNEQPLHMPILRGPRSLLVLDGICSEDPNVLDHIQGLLCLRNTKIVVTTQNESVARNMNAADICRLQGLPPDDCWRLFEKQAFDGQDLAKCMNLVDIGRKIVQKCSGLPLALITLGNLLRYDRDEERWIEVLQTDMWRLDESTDGVMSSLRKSYDHLPYHLKTCFAYCSLFPKGYKFKRDDLVRFWMAQGYVHPRESKTLEDVGIEYVHELHMRSFFHGAVDSEHTNMFAMHDLIHELSRSISGEDCYIIQRPEDSVEFPSEVRHVYLASRMPILPLQPGSQRTYIYTCTEHACPHLDIANSFFENLKLLRLLDLNCIGIRELPDSIGNLRHLRYLRLKSSIKCLPESVCRLYNLVTLDLLGCEALVRLPEAIGNLVNLRHLELPAKTNNENTSAVDLTVSTVRIPSGIGKLVNLQALVGVCVGRDCGIEVFEDLTSLQGNLCISGLRNVANVDDARMANLTGKEYLKFLKLEWPNSGLLDEDTEQNVPGSTSAQHDDVLLPTFTGVIPEMLEEGVLESLQPHGNLAGLVIKGYNGSIFPKWISDPSFSKLTSVVLMGGDQSNCSFLPPLGQLPSLKYLSIGWMNGIHTIGREFCCLPEDMPAKAFLSLEELSFENMLKLEVWCGVLDGDFPRLRKVQILSCPKLRALPNMSKLFELMSIPMLPKLQHVDIRDCPELNEWCQKYRLHQVDDIQQFESLEDSPRILSQFESTMDLPQTSSQFEGEVEKTQTTYQQSKESGEQPWKRCLEDSAIYGREDDERRVIELLLSSDCRERNVSVIHIFASSGVGKTTLASLVYSNSRVCEIFETRVWICSTEGFDAMGHAKVIIEALTGISCCLTEPVEVQETLKEELVGKKFLLVLDNVCNEDLSFWSSLLDPLSAGAKGSIVIATSRSKLVSRMDLMHSYELKLLSEDDCWSIFQHHAFDHDVKSNRIEIGKQIVSKCGGLPLSVMALGGLLSLANSEKSWSTVLESGLSNTNGNLSALRLSYAHLPVYLKRCFGYCSLFPKGYLFERDHLVYLWLSQGFIEHREGKQVEDTGNEYIDELLRRSFLQHSPICDSLEGKYVMHDLFHDLAQSVSVNECFRSESYEVSTTPRMVHHMSLVPRYSDRLVEFDSLQKSKDIHTCLVINRFSLKWDTSLFHVQNSAILDDLFLQCSCLRTLDLGFTDIEVLPDSIANLKHLCYLGLNKTNIKSLPESICNLCNLQSLELQDCSYLHELPKDTKNLATLRHLDVWKESGFVLMPPGIGQLTGLQTLSTFHVGRDEQYCGIRELKDMVNLRGTLCIGGLENVINGEEAKEANLRMKSRIHSLTLEWCDSELDLDHDDGAGAASEVLLNLQASTNLEELIIRNYCGGQFSSWVGDPSFSKLTSITLDNCFECDVLPPLGHLPSLKYLSIRMMDGLQSIGHDFLGPVSMVSHRFPSLEILKLSEMSELAEWCAAESGDFPHLRSISISRCHKLRTLPSFTSLVELTVHCCTQLPDLPTLPCLESLKIEGIQNLKFFPLLPDLPALKMLDIKHCTMLSSVRDLSHLSSVELLKVVNCPKLYFSPHEKLPSMLRAVEIHRGCALLKDWCPIGFEEISDAHQATRKLSKQRK